MAGLEPAQLSLLPPQDSVSTNSTTSAGNRRVKLIKIRLFRSAIRRRLGKRTVVVLRRFRSRRLCGLLIRADRFGLLLAGRAVETAVEAIDGGLDAGPVLGRSGLFLLLHDRARERRLGAALAAQAGRQDRQRQTDREKSNGKPAGRPRQEIPGAARAEYRAGSTRAERRTHRGARAALYQHDGYQAHGHQDLKNY